MYYYFHQHQTRVAMKKIITALIFLASSPALAGDLYLDVNGYSFHSSDSYVYRGKPGKYNPQNAGLGVTYGLAKNVEVFAGYYYNSFNRDTLYGGAKLKHDFAFGNVTVTPGLNVGVATGYENTPAQSDYYQVVIMPTVRVTYRGVGMTLGYVPRFEKENFTAVSIITAQINIRVH